MYDEAADVANHLKEIATMDEALREARTGVDWPRSIVCDVGGGGGLRAALLSTRVARAYCADVIDQQARYHGEFVRLLGEKLARHGRQLAIDRFEIHVTDAMALIYRDELFDFVCSVNAFEHIPDPARALQEIARVLKAGAVAYISFDPIWTADTGSHFFHRVPEPWAHLVCGEEEFMERMRGAGSPAPELEEFRCAMNRVRLGRYLEILSESALARLGLDIVSFRKWEGLERPEHLEHENYAKAVARFRREDLLTRGIACVLRKRPDESRK